MSVRPDLWRGDPIFRRPSRCNDDSYRVFHRDFPGRVVAHFYGDNAGVMAERFCELFGEEDGSKAKVPVGLREIEMPQESADQIDEILASHRDSIQRENESWSKLGGRVVGAEGDDLTAPPQENSDV